MHVTFEYSVLFWFDSILFSLDWLWNSSAAPGSSRYWWWHIWSVSRRRGGGTRARPPPDGCEPAIMPSREAPRWATVSASSPALLTLLTWLFFLQYTHKHTHCITTPFITWTAFPAPWFELKWSILLLITFKQRRNKYLIPSFHNIYFFNNLEAVDYKRMFRMEYQCCVYCCIVTWPHCVACLIQCHAVVQNYCRMFCIHIQICGKQCLNSWQCDQKVKVAIGITSY